MPPDELDAALDDELALAELVLDVEGSPPPDEAVEPVDESDADGHALTMPAPEPDSSKRTLTVRPAQRAQSIPAESIAPAPPSKMWTLVWVVAAMVGLSIGAWLALR